MPKRWVQARLQPFETAFAFIIMSQGLIGLLGFSLVDPAAELLDGWLSVMYQVLYTLAGFALLVGLLWPRGDVEGGGLILLALVLIARGVLFGQALDWGLRAITSLAFSGFLVAACTMRLIVLAKTAAPAVIAEVKGDDGDPP